MQVLPAIDLKDGRCVRLRQGDMHQETVYSSDPANIAVQWQGQGASYLHVVDLNGAVEGRPANLPQLEAILNAVSVPIQVGGGIRSIETICKYLERGVARVVLGTAALEDRQLVEDACQKFPGRILLGMDARNGLLALRGWTDLSEVKAADLLASLAAYPLGGVVYTDIARDGMLGGPNLSALQEVAQASPVPVIASGGVTSIDDIYALKRLEPAIAGVIIGKALYDGKLELASAIRAAAEGPGLESC